jgi:hypothetical protein
MTQSKRMAVSGFNRAELIQSAGPEKKANLTPWAPDKAERVTENIENSVPYRLLTGEAHRHGV